MVPHEAREKGTGAGNPSFLTCPSFLLFVTRELFQWSNTEFPKIGAPIGKKEFKGSYVGAH